jgi:hypothetical protein
MAVQDQGIVLRGFTDLQRALADLGGRGEFGLDYELSRRLRTVGEKVGRDAAGYVTHRTGRHGDPGDPRLEDSVKVAVGRRAASVYSTAVYGGAQNYGAGPKAGWGARGPHIKRADASRWMTRAVDANEAFVAAEMDGLCDWIVREFERG